MRKSLHGYELGGEAKAKAMAMSVTTCSVTPCNIGLRGLGECKANVE
jgi:hypothetical protein